MRAAGRHEEAARQLEAYLRVMPSAGDRRDVQEMVNQLRSGEYDDDGSGS